MKQTSLWVLVVLVALLSVSSANAAIIFTLGNNPQPNEENVLFNGPGLIGGPALTVTGRTNMSSIIVSFSGAGENLITPASGQSRVEASDGAFRNLLISVPGGTFTDIIFNLNTVNSTPGTATITVNEAVGGPATFALPVGMGQNFLTIVATGTDKITGVGISSTVDVNDIRQTRISGAQIPEPGTLTLAGTALIGLCGMFLRRKRTGSTE